MQTSTHYTCKQVPPFPQGNFGSTEELMYLLIMIYQTILGEHNITESINNKNGLSDQHPL